MAIRLSGLNSGLDTDAIVQELVSAYSMKTEKYEKAQTKLTWKQDAWKSLNTKIYGLYTNVSNLRYSGAYNLRKVNVSDNTKATVTASAEATTGNQKLNILQTAQSGYITGGQLDKGVTAETKLSELGFDKSATIEVKKNDGTTEQIKVTKDTTVNDFISSLKGAGLNASYDANNRRIFVSSKASGVENDFTLTGLEENGEAALKALGLDVAMATKDTNGNIVFTEAAAAYKEAYEKFYVKAIAAGKDGSVESIQEYINEQIEKYDELQKDWNRNNGTALKAEAANRKAWDLLEKYEAADTDGRLAELESATAAYASAQEKVAEIQAQIDEAIANDPAADTTELQAQLASAQADLEVAAQELMDTTGMEDIDSAVEAANNQMEEIRSLPTLPDLIAENEQKIADARQAMEDAKAAQAALGVDEFIKIRDDNPDTDGLLKKAIYEASAKAVRGNDIITDTNGTYTNAGAIKIDAADAIIELNGVQFTGASNSFSINGLSIEAHAVTGSGDANAIQISTSVDAQGIYDKIKDFLTEYNNVINEMTKLYNAESASEYEPLTDEEKEAMSEEQIEKWENKIKDSLLRRDSSLNGIMSVMINSMAQTYTVNGQKLSLSTFGISTMGYLKSAENEHYAYHIDGDEDDENTSDKEDELMAAIKENPDQVVDFMKQLTSKLYEEVDKKMKSTSLSSAYKVYNDKELDKQLADYAKQIAKWEEKITDKEDYYYKKFTQMEKAMANLNNQTSSISSLLGMGQ